MEVCSHGRYQGSQRKVYINYLIDQHGVYLYHKEVCIKFLEFLITTNDDISMELVLANDSHGGYDCRLEYR